MDAIQSTACHRPHDRPRAADYGAVIRHLTFLCQQVEALATPLSAPGLPPHHSALPSALEAQGHRASTPSAARGGRGGGGRRPGSVVGFQAGFGGGGRAKRDLRQTGKDVIRIPKLVLVGGQSTVESSLVECLAGVTLPRSQGTCTRGPLDITITGTTPAEEGEGWSALVSIVLPTSKNDIPPACESCPGGIIRFGEPINDPALVADRLRRATLAVRDLRNLPTSFMPSPKPTDKYLIPASPYQHMSLAQLEDAEDDPDSPLPTFFPVGARLSLSIRAPGAEPLCFTDLPGLISEGSAFEINAIRNMILRDISESNTVIVLTASLAMDIRHQNAFSLVKSVDPNGECTVGVLTMPDRMPSGAERQWAKMINESSPGGMNSNNNSTHEDRSNIREIEDNLFFASDPAPGPWLETTKMLDVTGENGNEDFVQMRCGLDNLYQHLSHLLLQQIYTALPNTIASIIALKDELIAEHANATASDNVDNGSANSRFASSFHRSRVPFPGDRDFSPLPRRSANGHRFGQGMSHTGGVEGFDTIMELVKTLEAITKHLYFSKTAVIQELVPYLARELTLIAPIYLPFTAREIGDRSLVNIFRYVDAEEPHQLEEDPSGYLDDVEMVFAFDVHNADHGMRPSGQMSKTPTPAVGKPQQPRKKPITVDDLIEALYGDSTSNFFIEFANQLQRNHGTLQEKFQAFVQKYTGLCRARLAQLVKNAIPKNMRVKYPQLCMDILAITDNYVQSGLTSEMQRLSARVAVHPPDGHGGPNRVDSATEHGEGADFTPRTEYGTWMDHEVALFMKIRMSLLTKTRFDMGDKKFVPEASRMVDSAIKIGLVPDKALDKGSAGSSSGGTQTCGGGGSKLGGSTAEPDADARDTFAEVHRTPKRKSKAQLAAEAKEACDHNPRSPEVGSCEYDDEYIPSSTPTPTPAAAARKRTPKSASNAPAQPSENVNDKLALLSPFLAVINPSVYAALQLMAELRADFYFFALLVAREAQRIPVSLVQDLRAYLRNSLLGTIRADLGEEKLYKRYFYEADKPRRERVEWIGELRSRATKISEVVEKLEVVREQLEMERAANGRGAKWWRKSKSGGSRVGAKDHQQQQVQTEKQGETSMPNATTAPVTPPPKTKKSATTTPTGTTLPRAEISIKPSQSQSTTVTPTAKKTSPLTPRQSRSMFSTPDSTPTKPPPSQTQLRTSVTQSKRPPPSEADTPTRAAPRRTATLAAGGWQAVMDAQLHNEPCRVVNSSFTFPRSNFAEEDYDDASSDYLHNQPSQSDCEGEIRRSRVWGDNDNEPITIGSSDTEGVHWH
ncbi:uncharacterized protein UBRO_05594 [Ustilago bromivora]|uniref:Dynamin N-terminal domain-containing protein n=1 Tax=Ustilago bromivora TaxID=307758 RepID=A0A1K0G996_9BASI|nr:uncharacterized protein UBRO_05594 [Ustilago bromivora]